MRTVLTTDTARLEFSNAALDEARETSEHVAVDLDKPGHLVSTTIDDAESLK